jgi:hypothetical protein
MNCPACSNQLVEYKAGDLMIDICRDGCAGIWFDKDELEAVDEGKEPFPEELLQVLRNANVVIDHSKDRHCPKCANQVLAEQYYDSTGQVAIDTCMTCGGHWLDTGELKSVRQDNTEGAKRDEAINNYMQRNKERIKKIDSSHRVKSIFKLLF